MGMDGLSGIKEKKIKKEVNQETGVLYGSSELILKSPNILVNVM